MSETIIGLFPQSQEAEEVVPMLTNRGFGRADIDVIGGRNASLAGTGSDLIDKLTRLGLDDAEQKDDLIEAIGHGGTLIAARTPDQRRADQIEELMLEHGATKCMHAPDTGWSGA